MGKGKIYWSPSRYGFYSDECHCVDAMPDDIIAITRKLHRQLLAHNAAGYSIQSDKNGNPVAIRRVKTDDDKRRAAIRRVKKEAARRIDEFFPIWAQMNAIRLGIEDPRFAFIDAIRASSSIIEQNLSECHDTAGYPISDNPLWPEIEP